MIRKAIFTAVALAFLTVAASGCAVISTAISAGIAYGLYKATDH